MPRSTKVWRRAAPQNRHGGYESAGLGDTAFGDVVIVIVTYASGTSVRRAPQTATKSLYSASRLYGSQGSASHLAANATGRTLRGDGEPSRPRIVTDSRTAARQPSIIQRWQPE